MGIAERIPSYRLFGLWFRYRLVLALTAAAAGVGSAAKLWRKEKIKLPVYSTYGIYVPCSARYHVATTMNMSPLVSPSCSRKEETTKFWICIIPKKKVPCRMPATSTNLQYCAALSNVYGLFSSPLRQYVVHDQAKEKQRKKFFLKWQQDQARLDSRWPWFYNLDLYHGLYFGRAAPKCTASPDICMVRGTSWCDTKIKAMVQV